MTTPVKHTLRPIVTGTSVISIRTDRFIMMAADTLGSYGSLARFHDMKRIRAVGDQCLLGAGGEISDYQKVMEYLSELEDENYCYDDSVRLEAKEIHSYLTRICYNRRSRIDPFYNQLVIGGYLATEKTFYLGYTDMYGTTYCDNYVCTGFGAHLAYPLLRKGYAQYENEQSQMTLEQARDLLTNTMRITFATVNLNEVIVDEPIALETHWDLSEINPVKELQDPTRIRADDENERKDGGQ